MSLEQGPEPFGKYVLMERIAIGGMAEIFRSRLLEGGGEDLCIKRILPHYSEDDAFVNMFIDEASIAAKLQQENIVQIYDFDTVEGCYYIAMELIDGRDLKQTLEMCVERNTLIPVEIVMLITSRLCRALHYAHHKTIGGEPLNIVHRDVSPHNVMLSFNGDIKLTDFGIAKAASRLTTTRAGTVKGKCAYMSPEQARGKTIDGRSDLFSVGILMYEMLTGRRLFTGESDFDILTKVLKEPITPPHQYRQGLDPEVERICLRLLERDRDLRYANGSEADVDISRWIDTNVGDPVNAGVSRFLRSLFGLSGDPLPRGMAPAPVSRDEDLSAMADMKTAMFNREDFEQATPPPPAHNTNDRQPAAIDVGMQPRMVVPAPGGGSSSIHEEKTQAMDISQFTAAPGPGPGPTTPFAPPTISQGRQALQRPAPTPAPPQQRPTPIPAPMPAAPQPEKKKFGLIGALVALGVMGLITLILLGVAGWFIVKKTDLLGPRTAVSQNTGEDNGAAGELDEGDEGEKPAEVDGAGDGAGDGAVADGEGDKGEGDQGAGDQGEGDKEPAGEGDQGEGVAVKDGAGEGDQGEGDKEPAEVLNTTLTIKTSPKGATVALSGVDQEGTTPLKVPGLVRDATIKIEVSLDGYEPQEQELTLNKETMTADFTLKKVKDEGGGGEEKLSREELEERRKRLEEARKRREASKGNGTLSINAVPYAEVTLDGRRRGRTPMTVSVPAGGHTVILSNPDKKAKKLFKVNVAKDGTQKVFHIFK